MSRQNALASLGVVALALCAFATNGCEAVEGEAAAVDDGWDGKSDRSGRRTGQSLEFEVVLSVNGEIDEPSDSDARMGWKEDEDEGGYKLEKTFAVRTDKWSVSTFNDYYSLRLEEDGTFALDYGVGDWDQGVFASVKLPKRDGKFVGYDAPIELKAHAGDYASGAWGARAFVKITVKP